MLIIFRTLNSEIFFIIWEAIEYKCLGTHSDESCWVLWRTLITINTGIKSSRSPSATFKDGGLSLQTRTTEKEQVSELLRLDLGFQTTQHMVSLSRILSFGDRQAHVSFICRSWEVPEYATVALGTVRWWEAGVEGEKAVPYSKGLPKFHSTSSSHRILCH